MDTRVCGDALNNNGENIIHKAFTHYLHPIDKVTILVNMH
jgi:hypothetical protein